MARVGLNHALIVAVGAFALVACDLTNPGPVDDAALDDPLAEEAIVNGMGRALSRAVGYIAYTGGVVTREVVSAGLRNPATLGISLKQASGVLDPSWEESDDHWKYAQQARWVAEDGLRRIRAGEGAAFGTSLRGARGLVYAGFANRLLGENMCDAVIDGGPIEPRAVYFQRAEAAFTEAIAIALAAGNAQLATTARAGRASVRVWLGDWTGAVADAQQIPSTFVYQATYSSTDPDQYNRINAANVTNSRAHSVVGTFFESYYRETADKRTPWKIDPAFPKGILDVLWYFQTKYANRGAPINLVSGREMRLIIAESLLRKGDWSGALAMINALRAESGVAGWQANGVTETWTALGRERSIEFWLEGRRLGDLFRWTTDKVPVTFDEMTGRDRCFPIGITERDANPNF